MFYMPQMSPYNWLNLLLMFSFIYMYMISYIYFFKMNNLTIKKYFLQKKNFFWLW